MLVCVCLDWEFKMEIDEALETIGKHLKEIANTFTSDNKLNLLDRWNNFSEELKCVDNIKNIQNTYNYFGVSIKGEITKGVKAGGQLYFFNPEHQQILFVFSKADTLDDILETLSVRFDCFGPSMKDSLKFLDIVIKARKKLEGEGFIKQKLSDPNNWNFWNAEDFETVTIKRATDRQMEIFAKKLGEAFGKNIEKAQREYYKNT
jgi:hypothetical protein